LYPAYDKVRYVSAETHQNWFRGHPEPGDLIFVLKGTPGRVCVTPDPVDFCIAQDMVALRPDPSAIYPRFLFALLRSDAVQRQIENLHVGTLIPHFKKGDFSRLLLSIPDEPTQRAIGDIYFALSDKIDLNRRMNLTLEAIGYECFLAAIDNAELVPLEQIVDLNPPRKLEAGTVAPYIDMKALPTEGASIEQGVIDRAAGSGSRFINGDTLLARITPCLENGKTAFVDCLPDTVVGRGSTEFIVLRPKPGLPEQFAYYLARSPAFRAHAIASMTGTSGRQRVQVDALASYSTPRPTGDTAAQFASAVPTLFQLMRSNAQESQTLVNLRDALLPKLISGELRIKDAHQVVEEAV
jgi:type I restriction enzyme S subunit